ncbi:hypothetical protein FRACYDRAFT_251445 [Fragilariopsis cylindrus CCMP1102]|uniref:Ankyrin n=1 Tax=Fragilariopsis cylindrus CCMP1102 TaxID=635003 RepID=A0A1E7EMJ6_9STRA|nr:hypothetical protein FRACYDRAFT_251445 [Fragilariopsis cylindrus CCMP1102]|eukprot:OEU07169.1 hypothetical protein FRACYDRAFT_251445 [Fragilariopsis cylindrus CCMP1102]
MGNIPLSNNIPEGRRHQDVDDDDDGGTVIYGTSSTQQVDGVLTLKPITNKIKNNNNISIKINNIRYPFDPCKNNNGGSGGVPSSTVSILSSSRASISSTKTSSATISCLGKSMFLLPTKTKKSTKNGLKQPDSLTGSLPLHMICDSFRLDHRSNGNGNDNSGNGIIIGNTDSRSRRRDYIVSRLLVLQLLLTSYPFATKASDIYGRVPLHRALMANAPFEAIRLLVYRDPRVIACPCWDGVTPFAYAKKIYPIDSPVMHLLKLAWI